MKNILQMFPWNHKVSDKKTIDVYIIDYGSHFEVKINHGRNVKTISERPLKNDELTKFKMYRGLTIREMYQADRLNGRKLMNEIIVFPDLPGRIDKTEMYTREEALEQITTELSLYRYVEEIEPQINYHHVTDEEFKRLISPTLPGFS